MSEKRTIEVDLHGDVVWAGLDLFHFLSGVVAVIVPGDLLLKLTQTRRSHAE